MADWDVAVIGGGAAGLSAAADAAAQGLSCLLIDRMGGGGELMNLGALQGLEEALTGPDLAARLLEAASAAGAELGIAEVTALRRIGDRWRITTDDEAHTAGAVILAVGLAPGTLGLANEAAYEGRGLSHCAACDAPLFVGQPVVVAGADRWARQEALELAAVASSVTLVTQGAPAPALQNVAVLSGWVAALNGADGLESVTVRLGNGSETMVAASGIFIQAGRRPALGLTPADVACDDAGRVVADSALRTDRPGLFVAGDARCGSPRTLAAAMADGRAAAAAAGGSPARP